MKHSYFTRFCASWAFLFALFFSNNLAAQIDCLCVGGSQADPEPLYADIDCMARLDTFDLDDLTPCTGDFFFYAINPNTGDTIASGMNAVVVDLQPLLGQVLVVSIENPENNGSCFSYYEAADTTAPSIDCPFDTVTCAGFPDSVLMPIVTDNCDNFTLSPPVDSNVFLNCVDGFLKRVFRKYSVSGNNGTLAECQQEIMIRVAEIDSIQFPKDTLLDCYADFDPTVTGSPTLFGTPIGNSLDCNLKAVHTDGITEISCGDLLVLRRWVVTDECDANAIRMDTQIIKLKDTIPPSFTTCLPLYIFDADADCNANPVVPVPGATDNCSDVTIRAFTTTGEGVLMADGFHFTGLTEGDYPLLFTATDSCDYQDTCRSVIRIRDVTTPTAVCEGTMVVNLNNMGMAILNASSVDDGSNDNCNHPLGFQISRDGSTMYGDSVKFDCNDALEDSIMVTLLVIDMVNSDSSICMTWVKVFDKTDPNLVCPNDTIVDCDFDYSNLAVFGSPPTLSDECGVTTVMDSTLNITGCGSGTITRTWTVEDPSGNDATCTQTITVVNQTPYDGTGIVWPRDTAFAISCAMPSELEPDDLPIGYNRPILPDAPCAMLMTSYKDQLFYIDFPACYKIVRTWKVLDWCQYIPNDPNSGGLWEDQQVIAVMDNDPPTVTYCPPADTFGLNNDCTFGVVSLPPVAASGLCPNEDIIITNDSPYATSNGADASGNYPEGDYTIHFTITDGCGNETSCSTDITVTDLKPPSPFCKDGIVAELQFMPNATPSEMAVVDASQLNDKSFDNCTASDDLVYTMRIVGDTDPPTAFIVFDCDGEGTHDVEIWVTDEAGNTDFCTTDIIIQDNMDVCPDTLVVNNGMIGGGIETSTGDLFPEVNVNISSMNMSYMTDDDGHFEFQNLNVGGDYTVEPSKNTDPKNGVTTYDLVLMTRHILNVQPLNDPYKLIAADVNNSGAVTTFDVVELRKLILGIYPVFPDNSSWRFVKKDYVFPNPTTPADPPFPEVVNVNNLSTDVLDADFVGVKIGDVNGSVSVNFNDTENRNTENFNILLKDRKVQAGEEFTIAFRPTRETNLLALQFTLEFETNLELQGIEKGVLSSVAGDRFVTSSIKDGIMTGNWYHTSPVLATTEDALFSLRFISKKTGLLSEMISLTSHHTEAVVYDEREIPLNLNLAFSNPPDMQTNHAFELHQNQPNPFKRATNIAFTLPEPGPAKLTIYDVSGNVLKVYDRVCQEGYNEVNIMRQELPKGGVLFYQLQTPGHTATKKMILLQ